MYYQKPPNKGTPVPGGFANEFHQIFKKETMSILEKLF